MLSPFLTLPTLRTDQLITLPFCLVLLVVCVCLFCVCSCFGWFSVLFLCFVCVFSVGIVTAYRTLYWSCLSSLLKSTIVKMDDVFALINHLIEFVNMQLAYRHDERPGESYEALDGKKRLLPK